MRIAALRPAVLAAVLVLLVGSPSTGRATQYNVNLSLPIENVRPTVTITGVITTDGFIGVVPAFSGISGHFLVAELLISDGVQTVSLNNPLVNLVGPEL